eukprot:1003-Chlamydomonas_euryale.AAC.8
MANTGRAKSLHASVSLAWQAGAAAAQPDCINVDEPEGVWPGGQACGVTASGRAWLASPRDEQEAGGQA